MSSLTKEIEGRFRALDADSEQGAAYLHDLDWARRNAAASRRAMAAEAERVIQDAIGARPLWETSISTDHNHVALEQHGVSNFRVHRKGAMVLQAGELGELPGSMGTLSFRVEGRGCEEALNSSAQGAGRAMSRSEGRGKSHLQNCNGKRSVSGLIGVSLMQSATKRHRDTRIFVPF